jgi:hypothetical protein
MNNIFKILIFIILLITIFFLLICTNEYFTEINNPEIHNPEIHNPEISYKITNNCNYQITKNLKEILEQNYIKPYNTYKNTKTIIHIPCTYDSPKNEIEKIDLNNKYNHFVFILNNPDLAVAKDYLWSNLILYYGLHKTLQLVPMTYTIKHQNERDRLKKEYNPNKLYILKKNIQRQNGIKITNSIEEIVSNNIKYCVAQELLEEPYLIKGRKINLRVYVLVVCYKDKYKVYVYDDGFMYYTKDLYKKGSMDNGPNITTGYVDRWIYDVHPLTHADFRNYLDNTDRELYYTEVKLISEKTKVSSHLFNNIYKLIEKVFRAFYKKIGNGEELYNVTSFQLFGLDIAVDNLLEPKLMEINKGPDLDSKDDRDGKVKKGLIRDIFKTLNIIRDEKSNSFIKVLDI